MSNDAANALDDSDDDHPVLEMHMSSPHLMPRPLIGFIDSNRSQAPGVKAASVEDAVTMTVAAAEVLVQTIAIYVGCGAAFAAVFLWRWVGILDPAAAHGTFGFRVLVFPGVAALWPLFAVRVIRR